MKARIFGLALAALALAAPAAAHQFHKGALNIVHPSSRPAARGMNGVGYLTVTNTGATPDVLLAVETPAAHHAELHATSVKDGVARMEKLKGGLTVPAKGTAKLAPGGAHLMLVKLTRPLAVGDRVPATLVFRNAGRVKIAFLVQQGREEHAGH